MAEIETMMAKTKVETSLCNVPSEVVERGKTQRKASVTHERFFML